MGIDGAALAYVVAALVVFMLGVASGAGHAAPQGLAWRIRDPQALITSVPMLWIDAMDVALHQTGILLLGVWASAEDVGIYGAVGRLVAVMTLVFIVTRASSVPDSPSYTRGAKKKPSGCSPAIPASS